MDASVEQATREFASTLRASPAIAAFWQAKEQLEADAEAQRLLTAFQERQQALMLKQQNGSGISQEEIDALRRLQGEAQSNSVIIAYVQAQRRAQAFLPRVNTEISQLLGFDFGGVAGAG
ncbi:MAG: YlbF family regulator [Anaerolineae bacterium]